MATLCGGSYVSPTLGVTKKSVGGQVRSNLENALTISKKPVRVKTMSSEFCLPGERERATDRRASGRSHTPGVVPFFRHIRIPADSLTCPGVQPNMAPV